MTEMTEMAEMLIERATAVISPRQIGDHLIGDVGCALVTDQGNIFVGVCLDLPSGLGFCAEASAIAAMVTAGERRIAQIVAAWKDADDAVYILSPCGRCREFIAQIDSANMETGVILANDRAIPLRDLLPQHHLFLPYGRESCMTKDQRSQEPIE
jgi:cytidine deaminase